MMNVNDYEPFPELLAHVYCTVVGEPRGWFCDDYFYTLEEARLHALLSELETRDLRSRWRVFGGYTMGECNAYCRANPRPRFTIDVLVKAKPKPKPKPKPRVRVPALVS